MRKDVMRSNEMRSSKRRWRAHSGLPCSGMFNSDNLRTGDKIVVVSKFGINKFKQF